MDKKYIQTIEKKILELLPEEKRREKAILLGDCCSELSRLVASWIGESDKSIRQAILKGDNVCDTKKSHDILAGIENGTVYLIDPTIWQFFPDQNSILVGEYDSLDKAITAATDKYGGYWRKSEDLNKISLEEKDEWSRIIKQNIQENLSEL